MEGEQDERRPEEGEGFGEVAAKEEVVGEVGGREIEGGRDDSARFAPPFAGEGISG